MEHATKDYCLMCQAMSSSNGKMLEKHLKNKFGGCPTCIKHGDCDLCHKIDNVDEIKSEENHCLMCQAASGPNGMILGKQLKKKFRGCPNCAKYGKCDLCHNIDDIEIFIKVYLEPFSDSYTISDKGRCFSNKTNKEMATILKKGYMCVSLRNKEAGKKTMSIHKLVYASFNENYDSKKDIDHIDNDKKNNDLNNLQNISRSEHAKKTRNNNERKEEIIQAFNKNGVFVREFDKKVKRLNLFITQVEAQLVIV